MPYPHRSHRTEGTASRRPQNKRHYRRKGSISCCFTATIWAKRLNASEYGLINKALRESREHYMEQREFEKLVAQALDSLPEAFREKLTNVAIIIEDLPPEEPKRGGLLLGLFHGIPRTEKSIFWSSPPDRIFLYQRNIEAICNSDAEVRRQVRATLLHEVGHYFGLTEDELREV